MFGFFKGCRLARMSSGRFCVVRDLGLVKGGKGMRHHEVVIAFSVRELLKWLRQPSAKQAEPDASSRASSALPHEPEALANLGPRS
ncbi:hypothetical protein [Bradyrhizobium sp. AUGA SZCCT0160]|uniref:hypothetical protein n=1 Tax=Bradyrhizobium sp. AUGA SZCCT0160 TaxID=2807662 RepID=UPI002013185D|nr:hypothetical protein [Bradyrhizobium sp. AUGA SZCCT0160]